METLRPSEVQSVHETRCPRLWPDLHLPLRVTWPNMTMPVVLGASQLEGPRGGWATLSTASLEQRRSIGPTQASLAALNPAPWAFAMEPGAAWGPGLKRYVFNLALNEFTKSASLMSTGSEFHKSQFILWGRVIDFFLSSASPSSPLPAANPLPPGLNCLI